MADEELLQESIEPGLTLPPNIGHRRAALDRGQACFANERQERSLYGRHRSAAHRVSIAVTQAAGCR
jgi:hypothetical protein